VSARPRTAELVAKLFWSSRPISWINTAYPFGAAYLFFKWMSDSRLHLDLNFWLGFLFFLIPYNLLMYGLNDVFDYESDLKNPRKGGIEGALLEPRWHRPMVFWSIASCVPFLLIFAFTWNPAALAWLAVFTFTVVAYSAKGLRFKEIPVLDSITSSSHFVGPMIVGAALATGNLWTPSSTLLAIAFGCWGMASHAFGAIQDIRADREANIASVATVFGAKRTAWFVVLLYVAAIASVWFALGLAGLPLVAVGCAYLWAVAPSTRLRDDECEKSNRGWKKFLWLNMIAGFAATIQLILAMLPAN
jgi:4-hydroxybenzoate polyprenyltransferase